MVEESKIVNSVTEHSQQHVLKHLNELSDDERLSLFRDLDAIDFSEMDYQYKQSKITENLAARLQPPDAQVCGSFHALRSENPKMLESYKELALQNIRQGKVAVLLLAGGQGTRLGVSYPKGLYKPDLPSGRSLLQLQAERILHAAKLAQEDAAKPLPTIPWYIMTSEHTQDLSRRFFQEHNYFGHDPANIVFFEQYTLPVSDFDGKLILDQKHKISNAPDGNGGLYRALEARGILTDMQQRGVEYVQTYCVDNILVKLPDLHFIGFCLSKAAECGAEVVQKVEPSEPIGVIGVIDGRYQVVEYSEITPETAALRVQPASHANNNEHQQPARLVYSQGNICVHFMTRDFLTRVSQPSLQRKMCHHVAKKKVPYIDLETGDRIKPVKPNGVKLEKFIFDVFPFADHFAIWEVPRDEYFSPLKNNDHVGVDCPQTCRSSLLAYHAKLALRADAKFTANGDSSHQAGDDDSSVTDAVVVEISPLVTSTGENLSFLKGTILHGTNLVELDVKTGQPMLINLTK